MSHAQTGWNTAVHDTHIVCRLPAPARLLRHYTQGKKKDNTLVITQTGEWKMMFIREMEKRWGEIKKKQEMVDQTSCTCIFTMLWLMHNTWWLYIQFFHICIMLRSCSPCLLTVSSKCYVFRMSPCLWVQYNMLLPADTFSFPPVSHFLTTSFCPFVTRSKRVLVHTRRKVKK